MYWPCTKVRERPTGPSERDDTSGKLIIVEPKNGQLMPVGDVSLS